uniref:Uncharacterized protein n=1 Tax=Rhizophora mucronata TaxID=61149 RepID=A0A2P2MSZ6_RHIMU
MRTLSLNWIGPQDTRSVLG